MNWYIIGFAAFVSLVFGGRRLIEVSTLVRRTMQKIEDGKVAGLDTLYVDFTIDEVLIVLENKATLSVPFTGSKRERTAFSRKNHYDRFGPALVKALGKDDYGYFHYTDASGYFCTYICENEAMENEKHRVFKDAGKNG